MLLWEGAGMKSAIWSQIMANGRHDYDSLGGAGIDMETRTTYCMSIITRQSVFNDEKSIC